SIGSTSIRSISAVSKPVTVRSKSSSSALSSLNSSAVISTDQPPSSESLFSARAYAIENGSACTQTLFGAAEIEPYAYDPDKARALLAEAGVPSGLTVEFLGPVGRYTKDKE